MSQHHCVLLLGSNLGDKKENLNTALLCIATSGCIILQKTDILTSIPVEFASCNNFCNIATSIRTSFSPVKLLEIIKKIEIKMGRIEDTVATGEYRDRIIDIDIISFDAIHFLSEGLGIPHKKHIYERDFSRKLLIELEKLDTQHQI